jgi:mRNA interferase RelE/StbE
MAYEIILAPEAVSELKVLPARLRAAVTDGLERHLRDEPAKISRSRIKRLRGMRQAQFRLRVGEVRIFYDIVGSTVEILAIVAKSEAERWPRQFGEPE